MMERAFLKDLVLKSTSFFVFFAFAFTSLETLAQASVIDENEFQEQNLQNGNFRQYVQDICNGVIQVELTVDFSTFCGATNGGSDGSGAAATFSLNFGGGAGSQLRAAVADEREDEINGRKGGSAGVSFGNFGLLFTSMNGTTERKPTTLESGFETDLDATIVGVDYAFSDAFLLGVAATDAEDEGEFVGATGSMKTESESMIYYFSWSITDSLGLGFYSGDADNDYFNSRPVEMGTINGTVTGNYGGEQSLQGVSLDYNWSSDSWHLGAFAALDKIDTEIDPYTEAGVDSVTGDDTLLEFTYPEQTVKSETQTLGVQLGYTFSFGWGVITPSVKYSSVDEKENDQRSIDARLALFDEATPLAIQTDEPDRKYDYQTLSLVGATNFGLQVFLTHEKRSGHVYLEDSFTNAGAIFSF